MKLSDLRNVLNRWSVADDDLEVVIPVKVVGSAGARPCVKLKLAAAGCDWDTGKLFLYPEVELREVDRDELKAIQKRLDEIGWDMYENRCLKSENKKLKKQIEELKK